MSLLQSLPGFLKIWLGHFESPEKNSVAIFLSIDIIIDIESWVGNLIEVAAVTPSGLSSAHKYSPTSHEIS